MDEHTIDLAGTPVFYRGAPAAGGTPTPVYLHGIPTSSDEWTGLLERTGGVAPDLIGFGRSGKGGHLEYTVAGLARFVERLLAELGVERAAVVGHDLGAAVALALAPALVERAAVCSPLLGGSSWRRIAGLLRRRVLGELTMGSTPRWLLERTLRRAGLPKQRARAVWDHFDQGTQRAILRLCRAGAPFAPVSRDAPFAVGVAPELVVWGLRDPWLPADFAERFPEADVVAIAQAGHWPWLQSSEAAERIAEFVSR